MGDFERTFGAGADAVAIVEGFARAAARERNFSPSPVGEPDLDKAPCLKCNGLGRIRRYKHIEGGKCFSCNGTGAVWVKKHPKLEHASLDITLAVIQNLAPKHDSFGDLIRDFRKNYAELISGMTDPHEFRTRVSIGDVAVAFDPCDAIELAMQIPKVDRRAILRIALLAAERAAKATLEPSLAKAVSDVREKIELQNDEMIVQSGPLVSVGDSRPVRAAKSCRDFLVRMAEKKDAADPYSASKFARLTMAQARYVFEEFARARGAEGGAAFAQEKQRQVDDVIAVSPLSAMGR